MLPPDELEPVRQAEDRDDDDVADAAGEAEAEGQAEADLESGTEHAPQPIRSGERVLAVGFAGYGKSEVLLNLFAITRRQRILIDVQDHYVLGPDALAEDPPPLDGVDDPGQIDWNHRTIRYVPRRAGDRREMDRLHAAIFRQGNMLVIADELEDIAPSQGGGAPFFVKKTTKQGRKVKILYAGASQRPAGVERSFINQANHAFVFPMIDPDDLKVISHRLGMSVHELSTALNQLDQYEYLRHDMGIRDERNRPLVLHMPALPPETIELTRRHVINEEHQ